MDCNFTSGLVPLLRLARMVVQIRGKMPKARWEGCYIILTKDRGLLFRYIVSPTLFSQEQGGRNSEVHVGYRRQFISRTLRKRQEVVGLPHRRFSELLRAEWTATNVKASASDNGVANTVGSPVAGNVLQAIEIHGNVTFCRVRAHNTLDTCQACPETTPHFRRMIVQG